MHDNEPTDYIQPHDEQRGTATAVNIGGEARPDFGALVATDSRRAVLDALHKQHEERVERAILIWDTLTGSPVADITALDVEIQIAFTLLDYDGRVDARWTTEYREALDLLHPGQILIMNRIWSRRGLGEFLNGFPSAEEPLLGNWPELVRAFVEHVA